MARGKDKGKGKALPSEHSPLLPNDDPESSSSAHYDSVPSPSRSLIRRSRIDVLSILLTVTLFALSLCFLGIFLALLLGYSYGVPASRTTPEALLKHAVHVAGPKEIEVLNVSDAGLWMRVEGWAGVDTDWVMGFRTPDDEEPWWERARRWIGRRGVESLDEVTVELSLIEIFSATSDRPIAVVKVPPLTIPLTPALRRSSLAGHEDQPAWLTPMSVTALVSPSHDSGTLLRFAQVAWATGRLEVSAKVKVVRAQGGQIGIRDWKSYIVASKEDVRTDIRFHIPELPGFPPPGTPINELLSHLSLDSYSLQPGTNSTLCLSGCASFPFPLPKEPPIRQFDFPLSIPFVVSLLPFPPNDTIKPLPIARLYTSPLLLPPMTSNLSISLNGTLLPLEGTSPLLSGFLSTYLAGRPYPVQISSPSPHPGIPSFLSSLLSVVKVSYLFPGASPPPRLLEKVAIKGMRILPSDKKNEFLVSGDITALVSLPDKFSSISFDVSAVQPDVLIYDGPPQPNDLNAFAQLNAPVLAVSQTNLTILAPLEDIPVQILPGREAAFRAFVRKILFSGGAWAGIKGTTSVWSEVGGFGNVTVHGVKVQGGSRVGRGSVLASVWDAVLAP